MVSLSFIARENPRKIRERITPELPRAPRSMAEAQRADAWAAVVGAFCRSSAAAVPRVRPWYRVPVRHPGIH